MRDELGLRSSQPLTFCGIVQLLLPTPLQARSPDTNIVDVAAKLAPLAQCGRLAPNHLDAAVQGVALIALAWEKIVFAQGQGQRGVLGGGLVLTFFVIGL